MRNTHPNHVYVALVVIGILFASVATPAAAAGDGGGARASSTTINAAGTSAASAAACAWVFDTSLPGPYCDVSWGFISGRAAAGVTPPGPNSARAPLWAALESAVAADAACASLSTARACNDAAFACQWDANLWPRCSLDPEATALALARAGLCQGSMMARALPCALATSQAACAARNCTWQPSKQAPSSSGLALAGVASGGECNHPDWIAKTAESERGRGERRAVGRRYQSVWGACASVEGLWAVLDAAGACSRLSASERDCRARAPACQWDSRGKQCGTARASLLVAAGAALGPTYEAAARACGAAASSKECASMVISGPAGGTPIASACAIDKASLASLLRPDATGRSQPLPGCAARGGGGNGPQPTTIAPSPVAAPRNGAAASARALSGSRSIMVLAGVSLALAFAAGIL